MEPMEWVQIARTVWAHRRKLYAAAALLAPFALTALLVIFVLFAGGATPTETALATPSCQQQMAAQGVDAAKGVQFGPGPINNGKAVIAAGLQMKIPEKGIIIGLATAMQVLPGTENGDDAVTLDEDEDGGVGRHLDGVIVAVTASSAR